jgi:hypothetical protein
MGSNNLSGVDSGVEFLLSVFFWYFFASLPLGIASGVDSLAEFAC